MTEFSHTEKNNALESQARPPVGDSNTDLADALKRVAGDMGICVDGGDDHADEDDRGRGGAGRIEGSGDGGIGGIRGQGGQGGQGACDGTSGATGTDSAPVLASHGVSWLEYKRPAAMSALFSRRRPNIQDHSLPGGKRRKTDDPPRGVDGVVGRGELCSADLLQDLCDSD